MVLFAAFMSVNLESCSSEDYDNWTNRSAADADVIKDNMAFKVYNYSEGYEQYGEDYAELISFNSDLTALNIPSSVYHEKTGKSYSVKELSSYLSNKDTEYIELASVTIPNSVISIGEYAFYNCPQLSSVILSENLKTIGESAFSDCNISRIKLPKTLKSIRKGTFFRCENLMSVEFSEGIQNIGESAFEYCSNLTNITFPNTLTDIGSHAFWDSGLISVIIPDNVKYIQHGAFNNCPLNKVTIYGSPSIQDAAISLSEGADVYCYSPTPPKITDISFSGDGSAILYVPKGSKNEYEIGYWKYYFSEIKEMD